METLVRALTAQAERAMSRGDWTEAFELLRDAQASHPLAVEELELLAHSAYGAGDLEATLYAWEQLHGLRVEAGDLLGAAGAATTLAMYLMMDTGLMAPVRGWLARAERLLVGHDDTPIHAWLAMVRTYERFMCGDMTAAGGFAAKAVAFGVRHGAAAPVALGRVARARILILDGRVTEGLELLDEAAVATVSGELEPLAVGMVYCELICAMQGLAQYDRAEQWTEAMERWRQGTAFGGINGRCRVHRAEILRLRGSCGDAEEEALHACEELRPWMRREFGWPLMELGTIRLRRGDVPGAEEAFLAAHEHGWEPQPGLALVRLAQGEVMTAASLIRDALDRPRAVPSKERPPYGALPRAPLLDAQVEIAVTAGDLPTASAAAAELAQIAADFQSAAFGAAAVLARARVALALGDADAAVRAADEAMRCWSEVGAPYESAVARMVLAEAHRSLGNDIRAELEFRAAGITFRRVGAKLLAGRAAAAGSDVELGARVPADAVVRQHDAHRSEPRSSCTFRCEGDSRRIEFAGREVLLRDLKGMRYLARLLAGPGREFHVLDLVTMERGVLPRAPVGAVDDVTRAGGDDLGPLLDDTARQAYKRHLAEIEDDLDEATRLGDTERVALAIADRDYLVQELSRAFGISGRARPADSSAERARASVSRALRYAIDRIREHHHVLAEHLDNTIHTGTYCAYTPDPRVDADWRT